MIWRSRHFLIGRHISVLHSLLVSSPFTFGCSQTTHRTDNTGSVNIRYVGTNNKIKGGRCFLAAGITHGMYRKKAKRVFTSFIRPVKAVSLVHCFILFLYLIFFVRVFTKRGVWHLLLTIVYFFSAFMITRIRSVSLPCVCAKRNQGRKTVIAANVIAKKAGYNI